MQPILNRSCGLYPRNIPKHLRRILECRDELLAKERLQLHTYFLRRSPNKTIRKLTLPERTYLIDQLFRKKAYSSVILLEKRLIFDDFDTPKGSKNPFENLNYDTTATELKHFFASLVEVQNFNLLDTTMQKVIRQISSKNWLSALDIINSVFIYMTQKLSWTGSTKDLVYCDELIIKWIKWNIFLNETNKLPTPQIHPLVTPGFKLFMRRVRYDIDYERLLRRLEPIFDSDVISEFFTTLMRVFSLQHSPDLVTVIWKLKKNERLVLTRQDLTYIMKAYLSMEEYHLVCDVFNQNKAIQSDELQFDYLLLAHSHLRDWKAMKAKFNDLFGIGELPNINHYGIVMHAMAHYSDLNNVEKLFTQLLRRHLTPNFRILQSLLYAHYRTGDLRGCFNQFELFQKYNVKPSEFTYTLMFFVYRGLNDITGALRFLKGLSSKGQYVPAETHFATLIQMCARPCNHIIAQELFNIMIEHYHVEPTGKSISALMSVYNACGDYAQTFKIFKKYEPKLSKKTNITGIYLKATQAHLALGQYAKCMKMLDKITKIGGKTNSDFYLVFMNFLSCYSEDNLAAERVLNEMLKNEPALVTTQHFECIMNKYDKIGHRDGILRLYTLMTHSEIPVNSKILYYLVKATFKRQINTQKDVKQGIELVERIMRNTATKSLKINFDMLHPSVVTYPAKLIAKKFKSVKALQILRQYMELFYGNEESNQNNSRVFNRLTVLKAELTIYAELGDWVQFDIIFDKLIRGIDAYRVEAKSKGNNPRLGSIFFGILPYKIAHLEATHALTKLPQLMEALIKKGIIFDNHSWNEAIIALFKHPDTIEVGIKYVDEKLIYGFNLIHKIRSIKRYESLASSEAIERKVYSPNRGKPTLYITGQTYKIIINLLDQYFNEHINDPRPIIQYYSNKYANFMKGYLMRTKTSFRHWNVPSI